MKKPRYRVFTRSLRLRVAEEYINYNRFINIQTGKRADIKYTTNETSFQINFGYELV